MDYRIQKLVTTKWGGRGPSSPPCSAIRFSLSVSDPSYGVRQCCPNPDPGALFCCLNKPRTKTCLPKASWSGMFPLCYVVFPNPRNSFGTVSKCHSVIIRISLSLRSLSEILKSPLTLMPDSLAATSQLQGPRIPIKPPSGHMEGPWLWSPGLPSCSRMHKRFPWSLSITSSAKQCQKVLVG